MEEKMKDNRVYGFALVIYVIFLFASTSYWIDYVSGTGGENLGHMCIVMPSILVSIFYIISAILVFNEKYSKAVPFTLVALIFLLIIMSIALPNIEGFGATIIGFIFYLSVPLILSLSIANLDDNIKKNEDISKTYFPPPPQT